MTNWVSTSEAVKHLGISKALLLKLRVQGVLKPKTHYRKKNPIASRPTYLWNIDQCGDTLSHEPRIGRK